MESLSTSIWCPDQSAILALGPPSPGIDVRALLPIPPPPLSGALVEQRGNPAPRVSRVDHIVDLAVGRHVHALAMLVGGGDRSLEHALALLGVGDCLQLALHSQPHRALQTHPA